MFQINSIPLPSPSSKTTKAVPGRLHRSQGLFSSYREMPKSLCRGAGTLHVLFLIQLISCFFSRGQWVKAGREKAVGQQSSCHRSRAERLPCPSSCSISSSAETCLEDLAFLAAHHMVAFSPVSHLPWAWRPLFLHYVKPPAALKHIPGSIPFPPHCSNLQALVTAPHSPWFSVLLHSLLLIQLVCPPSSDLASAPFPHIP